VTKFVIGPVAAFPPGSRTSLDVDGRAVALFNVAGRYFALRDACPHMGAALSSGTVVSTVTSRLPGCYEHDPSQRLVRCPWHGWEYDLATGQSWFDPVHNRVKSYPASVESGSTLLTERRPGPYTVESFTVSVEDDYVVIES
jgi:nitrite reductase/ring-hydroxylating ferredoxin subunit